MLGNRISELDELGEASISEEAMMTIIDYLLFDFSGVRSRELKKLDEDHFIENKFLLDDGQEEDNDLSSECESEVGKRTVNIREVKVLTEILIKK